MAKKEADAPSVIVIGGGIAGLGAARELALKGWSVTLLEGRDRWGGRIHSIRIARRRQPVELGAEFVHGRNADFSALLRRAGVRLDRVSREIYHHDGHALVRGKNHWRDIAELMKRLPGKTQQPFSSFLQRWSGRTSGDVLRHARDHVEGFNAAPVNQMSAAALRADHAGADHVQYRLQGGYLPLVETLVDDVLALGVQCHLNTVVKRVDWKRGAVRVSAASGRNSRTQTVSAERAVITLPLGVLKQGTVVFSPRLHSVESIVRRLGWGTVTRVTLRFSAAFWARAWVRTTVVKKHPGDLPFFTGSGLSFPVWWVPSRDPIVVGWAGGPASQHLSRYSAGGLRNEALHSLSELWGLSFRMLRSELVGFWSHDWTKDPFSAGAYSFAAAGFEKGPQLLSRAIQHTMYFAGEAASDDLGTVHGALASGVSAAQRLHAQWAKSSRIKPNSRRA